MNVVRLFAMGIGVLILLAILNGFRRQMRGIPRRKVMVYIAGGSIGCSMTYYGIRELLSGRWMGMIWFLVGLGINYIAARELRQTEVWQKRVKGLKPLTRTGRLIEYLAFVLIGLLLIIILVVSGGDLPRMYWPLW